MLSTTVFLQLVLWISAVHAFYPWFPSYVCKEDGPCSNTAASAEGAASASSTTEKERSVPAAQPRSFRLRRGRVGQLAQRRRAAAAATPTTVEPAKRSNAFTIAAAATPAATHSAGIDQDGTDFSYFVEATFGSENVPLYMLLDSGSGTTWVMGTGCTSDACAVHNSFGAADSQTLQTSSSTFSIAYGSGKVAGSLVSDTISVAGITMNMTFGLANTTSDDFTQFPFDGIMGLSLSVGSTDNFWQSVSDEQLLPANVFSVSLWREEDGGTNDGVLVLGGTDESLYTGDITYTDVAASGAWAITLDDLGFDGTLADLTDRLAYIDTGTTYAFGPPDDVAALHALIPGASSSDGGTTFTAPCSTDQPITIVFSGVSYNISSKDWLASGSDSSGNCTSNIYGHEVISGAWLLGDLYLKNVYTVFDVDQTRIGFANKASNSSTSTSTSATTTSTDTSSSTTTGTFPGLTGQESAVPAATAAATQASSPAGKLEENVPVTIACIVAAIMLALAV